MTPAFHFRPDGSAVELSAAGRPLLSYVPAPDLPRRESPKPYAHPVRTLGGQVLTALRPNDHPWHHALALTLTLVDGINFWGGPTWRSEGGYQWADNHGVQAHTGWRQAPDGGPVIVQEVAWTAPDGAVLFRECRRLEARFAPEPSAWTLRWTSELANTARRELVLSHYHADGLAGSHYTGLLFRGARDVLANTHDPLVGIVGPEGAPGADLHGASTPWLAWRCSHDGDPAARSTVVFHRGAPAEGVWFVRPTLPAVGFCFTYPGALRLPAGATLRLDHAIAVADGLPQPAALAAATSIA